MRLAPYFFRAVVAIAMFGLPVSVLLTATSVELALVTKDTLAVRHIAFIAISLALLVVAVFVLEFAPRHSIANGHPASRVKQSTHCDGNSITIVDVVVLQLLSVMLYGLIGDLGGEHLRAFCFAWLGYASGMALILARRWKVLTYGDWLYIRWAWVPIIVIAVPLFIRVWIAKGLL